MTRGFFAIVETCHGEFVGVIYPDPGAGMSGRRIFPRYGWTPPPVEEAILNSRRQGTVFETVFYIGCDRYAIRTQRSPGPP